MRTLISITLTVLLIFTPIVASACVGTSDEGQSDEGQNDAGKESSSTGGQSSEPQGERDGNGPLEDPGCWNGQWGTGPLCPELKQLEPTFK